MVDGICLETNQSYPGMERTDVPARRSISGGSYFDEASSPSASSFVSNSSGSSSHYEVERDSAGQMCIEGRDFLQELAKRPEAKKGWRDWIFEKTGIYIYKFGEAALAAGGAVFGCGNGEEQLDAGQPDGGQSIEGDEDGDGYRAQELGGEDCDDTNPAVHPRAEESCNEIDDNCNGRIDEGIPKTTYYRDGDRDGYGNIEEPQVACMIPEGYVDNSNDCDDTDLAINPRREDTCNGIDDNCDGRIDDDLPKWIFYRDADGDGYGNIEEPLFACAPPPGCVESGEDCDDTNNMVYPSVIEEIDGIDNDCDGITDEESWLQVSAGYQHSCGVKTYGAVECWGGNFFRQSNPPSGTFIQVSAGGEHTCGVRTDGAVKCWGYDAYGQSSPPPGTFTQVSAGYRHACGLKMDGTIECWGRNEGGESTPPSGRFTQVSAGELHTCGVRTNGAAECWGRNEDGESTPPSGRFAQVSAGQSHTCGVRTDGTVECWGDNERGEASPPSGSFTQVSAGSCHTCGLATDGQVECWGGNGVGQSNPPSGTFTQVSVGHVHTCGVRTTYEAVECWGSNEWGQSTPPGN